jgi:hypothetical protein
MVFGAIAAAVGGQVISKFAGKALGSILGKKGKELAPMVGGNPFGQLNVSNTNPISTLFKTLLSG